MVNAAGYTFTTATTWTGFTSANAAPTLSPAVPYNHDLGKIEHLNPSDNCAIHYTDSGVDSPTKQQIFASMNATFAYPAVVLQHSSLINNVTCTEGGLSLQLATQEALAYCKQNWSSSKIILVSTACGADGDGQNAYFVVSSVDYDASTLTAHCEATEVEIPDCMTNVELTWGTVSPNSTVYNSTSGSSTAPYGNSTSSSGPFGNSTAATNTTSSTAACGAPPAATISGFPAAACGENFDRTLDDMLGYRKPNPFQLRCGIIR